MGTIGAGRIIRGRNELRRRLQLQLSDPQPKQPSQLCRSGVAKLGVAGAVIGHRDYRRPDDLVFVDLLEQQNAIRFV
jgi:hypothetical protein